MTHLELQRCGICDGWVAAFGVFQVEDPCPLTACWWVLRFASAAVVPVKPA